MERIELASTVRTVRGKGPARQLRMKGVIPAVLYGGPAGNLALSVDSHEFRQILAKSAGETTLIALGINNVEPPQTVQVIVKDYQVDPVTRKLVHIDFFEVNMAQSIEIQVPIRLIGDSPGVKLGGVLEFITREITLECLPGDILPHIDVDVSALNIGDSIMVSDIHVGDKYRISTSPETVITDVVHPIAEAALEVQEGGPAEPELIQKGKKLEEAE